MKPSECKVSKEKLVFARTNDDIHDLKLDTKPMGYFKDAFYRFKKNKASITATFIIMFLVLFAIIVPFLTPYTVAYNDVNYAYALPKSQLFYDLKLGFWDGCDIKEAKAETFFREYAKGLETGHNSVRDQVYVKDTVKNKVSMKLEDVYVFDYDSYQAKGVIFKNVSAEEYKAIQEYQDRTGIQIIYPITLKDKRPLLSADNMDANYWYETNCTVSTTSLIYNKDGEAVFNNIYKPYSGNDDYTSTVRFEGEEKLYDYAYKNTTGYEIRILYYEYYIYYHTEVLKDGITEPCFLLGATNVGKDILTCLASGARFSFILAIIVACVNLFVGAIYGAIEGYYGGKIDLIMERICDILGAIPTMIVITLLKHNMRETSQILILFISFFLTGWMGMAGRTRMQFYRFKNQEYVFAARTLGAKDGRIMFKHIFPNAIGTLITSCVLVIPGVIFSETSLSYLGIINLDTGNLTSVGTLLSKGQGYLVNYPHMILFPSIFISLLMLSFNLFGNGLRDAFNPSLRGTGE